jgi:hypothetical protein
MCSRVPSEKTINQAVVKWYELVSNGYSSKSRL